MTVGIRNHPSQDRNGANSLPYFAMMSRQNSAGKSQYGSQVVDEQTVPQALQYQPKIDSYMKGTQHDFQAMDPLASYHWYSTQNLPLYNSNITAYPMMQANYDTSAMQGINEHAPLRQTSIPHGSLDQFLDNDAVFDYDQVLQHLDLSQYETPDQSFSLEDYANLDQVSEGMNFNIKHEKVEDKIDGKNLEEMENVLENNMLNTMVNYTGVTADMPVNNVGGNVVNIGNDQTLDEQNLIDMLEYYSSPNIDDWQSSNYLPITSQPLDVSGETVVKTESNDISSSCDLFISSPLSISDGVPSIGIPDDELIQMPVSRFNELLVALTAEQSNHAKDIRRRGKNKQAARLCRKRKLDNISSLEGTLQQMEEKKSKLLDERKEIVAETEELKSSIETICEMLMKGLNEQNVAVSELSVLHHSNGQTLIVPK